MLAKTFYKNHLNGYVQEIMKEQNRSFIYHLCWNLCKWRCHIKLLF